MFCGLCNGLSLGLFLVVVIRVLACPAISLLILSEQEPEGLTDDIGRVRVDEFSAPVQVMLDVCLLADLKSCGFRLL